MHLKSIEILRDKVERWDEYPFNIGAISNLVGLEFKDNVTFFVGENGSGKSTIIEAIAMALGFNGEGGTRNFNFSTKKTHSILHNYIKVNFHLLKPADVFFTEPKVFIT